MFFFLIVTWQLLQTSSERGVLISRFPARTHRTRNAGCPGGTGRATSPAGGDTVEPAVWQRPGAGGTALLSNCRKRSARPLRVLALGDCSPAQDGRELRLQAPRGCGLTLTQPPPGTGQSLGASPSHIKTGTFVPVRRSSKRGRRAAEPGQARRGLLRERSLGTAEQSSRGPATSQRSLPPAAAAVAAAPPPRCPAPRPPRRHWLPALPTSEPRPLSQPDVRFLLPDWPARPVNHSPSGRAARPARPRACAAVVRGGRSGPPPLPLRLGVPPRPAPLRSPAPGAGQVGSGSSARR